MFGNFVFCEIPEKTETPQKIFFFKWLLTQCQKREMYFQGLSLAIEVQLTRTKKLIYILAILNIQISFNSTNEFPEF